MITQAGAINGYTNYAAGVLPPNVNTQNNNFLNGLGISTNNYEDDIMMPADLKVNSASSTTPQPQTTEPAGQIQAPVSALQPSFGNNQSSVQLSQSPSADPVEEGLKNTLAKSDKNVSVSENGNPYEKSHFWKRTLAFLGFMSPIAGKINKLAKGGSFKELFKIKQLAIACPVIALAGLAIGALADSCTNTKRAKSADETVLAQNQDFQPVQLNAIA